jgi:transcriptional regulator with XRE-family HTH domain
MRNMTTQPQFTFGDGLRRVRMDAGLGSEEMADLLVCSRYSVGNWENDKNRPSTRKLRRLAEIVAERTDYEVDAVVEFLDPKPAIDLAERRKAKRRTPSRQPGRDDMWITAKRTVEERRVTNLKVA